MMATHGLPMMLTQPDWLSSLETLLSAGQIDTAPPHLQAHAVDGLVPRAIVYPDCPEQAAAVLHWGQREQLAILPRGSGTKIQQGGVPRRLDVVLSTGRLSHISEYDVENFTLTAGAGVQFSQIAELTAAHRQTLPLQYAFSAATLGGIIAANAYNPKRLLYGGARDLLLGLRVALPSGEVAHFGGKVVKNVAGYDMAKLFLGSHGALGVIVEATWKLFALPEHDASLLATFPSLGQGAAALAHLRGTQLLPSHTVLLNATAARAVAPTVFSNAPEVGTLLLVNCEGMEEAVERQLVDIARLCQGQGAVAVQRHSGEAQVELRRRLAPLYRCTALQPAPKPRVLVSLGTVPSRVPELMDDLARRLGPLTSQTLIAGDCGTGQVKLLSMGGDSESEVLATSFLPLLRQLPQMVAAEGGYVVLEDAPLQVKAQLDVWGTPPPSFSLLQTLKKTLDPAATLSPGRFLGNL
jgi:glycolate oxidase FAD binding subunit